MVRTVSDEGRAYGLTSTVRQNLVQEDNGADSKCFNVKMIIKALRMYSFPVNFRVLLYHLWCLSAVIMKWWMLVSLIAWMMFGTPSVDAEEVCPEPGVKRVNGFLIPDIHPCQALVNLAGSGIKELHFEAVYGRLRYLNVSSNYIENIQTGVFHDMKLNHLDVSLNRVTVVIKDTFNSSAIEWLYLRGNQIALIFKGTFDGLEDALQFLTLAYNQLENLPEGGFRNLKGLGSLDLSFNRISVVHQDAFKGTDNLHHLYLQGNRLTVVSGWLPPVDSQLDLSSNRITTTKGVPQISTLILDVTDNPLNCSQENKNFTKLCLQREHCHGPKANDLEARCDDDIDTSSDKSEGGSHLTNDTDMGNGGRGPYPSVILVVMCVLVGCFYAFGIGNQFTII